MEAGRYAEPVLRIAVAAEFAGHGAVALGVNPPWIPFITYWGFSAEIAPVLMRAVGVLDLTLAVLVLIRPIPAALAWMAFWGLFTALLRLLVNQSLFDFIERGPNCGAPLGLLLIRGWPRSVRGWLALPPSRPRPSSMSAAPPVDVQHDSNA